MATTLEEVWNEYRSALRAFLLKRVADPDDVDDLLQEVLIRTHKGLPSLRDPKNLRSWLFRIARNVTTDFYRRRGGETKIHPDDLWYGEDAPETLTELENCVQPFLNRLSENDADMLRAINLGDVSQKDYAASHGISYSTLKSRVQAARRDLRRTFDACCSMELDAQGRLVDYRPKSGRCENC